MKTFFTIILSLVFFCTINAQVSRTANQTITANSVTTINLNLDASNIEIVETKGSRIIIEAKITLEGITNLALLDFVINSGRYDLENKMDNTTQSLTISRKKAQNVLLVKGAEVKENIRYKILVPDSIKFINKKSTVTASVN